MSGRFTVVPVTPTGTHTGPAFVTERRGRCSYRDITTPVYPPSPQGEDLRRARVVYGLSLREVATALQLSAEQVNGLERGRYAFDNGDDWARALEVLGAGRQTGA